MVSPGRGRTVRLELVIVTPASALGGCLLCLSLMVAPPQESLLYRTLSFQFLGDTTLVFPAPDYHIISCGSLKSHHTLLNRSFLNTTRIILISVHHLFYLESQTYTTCSTKVHLTANNHSVGTKTTIFFVLANATNLGAGW